MKQFKLFLWIAGLLFLQTVLSVFRNYNGILPDLLFSFAIAYAAYERSLKPVMWITVICGVITCASTADEFVFVMIIFTAGAALTYMSYDAPHRMAGAMRALTGTVLFTAAGAVITYMLTTLSFDLNYFLYHILPVTALNAVCTVLIYAGLKKCFDIKDTAKKLIIS